MHAQVGYKNTIIQRKRNTRHGSSVLEYVVLSRVSTLSGLYLVKPIDMDNSFQPSPQLTSFMDKIRTYEKDMLEKRQEAITKTFS